MIDYVLQEHKSEKEKEIKDAGGFEPMFFYLWRNGELVMNGVENGNE